MKIGDRVEVMGGCNLIREGQQGIIVRFTPTRGKLVGVQIDNDPQPYFYYDRDVLSVLEPIHLEEAVEHVNELIYILNDAFDNYYERLCTERWVVLLSEVRDYLVMQAKKEKE